MKKLLLSLMAVVALLAPMAAVAPGAMALECAPYPASRATITTSVPYGGSATYNDLYTVKVINTSSDTCANPSVIITPRVGRGFGAIVSANGGWGCAALPDGDPGATICTNTTLAPYSSSTIRVQYNSLSAPTGAATVQLIIP